MGGGAGERTGGDKKVRVRTSSEVRVQGYRDARVPGILARRSAEVQR